MEDTFPISIQLFISLIEERPILWDKTQNAYKHKATTRNTWREILMKIYPDFGTWDNKQRLEYTKKTLKRWTYIRDTYLKSLKKIERQKLYGRPTTKRYMYHRYLSFLSKLVPSAQSVESAKPVEIAKSPQPTQPNPIELTIIKTEMVEPDSECAGGSSRPTKDYFTQSYDAQVQPQITENYRSKPPQTPPVMRGQSIMKLTSVDGKMTQAGNMFRHISFFNSLIPTLEKFNDDQIIEFQLGVIKLIKEIKAAGIPNSHLPKD